MALILNIYIIFISKILGVIKVLVMSDLRRKINTEINSKHLLQKYIKNSKIWHMSFLCYIDLIISQRKNNI